MKSIGKIIVLFLPLLLCNALHSYAESYGDYQGAIYLQNYDGDTIRFDLPGYPPIAGDDIRVRVNGIDTPEIKGKCEKEKYDAQQARDMVTDILNRIKFSILMEALVSKSEIIKVHNHFRMNLLD